MKTPADGGVGQFFFTGTDAPGTSEEASVRFNLSASDDFVTYTVDMTESPLWVGGDQHAALRSHHHLRHSRRSTIIRVIP